jgi:hypothetical protein
MLTVPITSASSGISVPSGRTIMSTVSATALYWLLNWLVTLGEQLESSTPRSNRTTMSKIKDMSFFLISNRILI